MKILGIFCFSSNRSVDTEAMMDGPRSISYGPSVIAPFDLDNIVCAKGPSNYKLPTASSITEEQQGNLLQLEMKGTAGSFFSRLLSREETTGNSSRIYYRAPHLGRVPFHWEAEPGKRKSSGRYYNEELLVDDHEMIPPLSPPPFLQAKSAVNSGGFSSGRTRVGLLHKIHNYFLQWKTHEKSKQTGMGYRKNSGGWVYSDWEIYGAAETETEIDCTESDFRHMSFDSSDRVQMI